MKFSNTNRCASLAVLAYFAMANTSLLAHPFHFSSAEMQWNEKSSTFEVALKVDPNDLEQELRRRTKKKLVLEKLDSNEVVFEYVGEAFQIEMGGKKLKLKPVGFEVETKSAWIYFEFPVASPLGDLKVTNRLLQQAPHQTNTLLFRFEKTKTSTQFNEEAVEQTFKWDATAKTFILKKTSTP
ncbi:DUF6702 family protein [Thalassoglobus polymorphus]|uniref:Uncharacterized protein n=1 Tax=Thalassoglobus polymorphus TaxID=2527994 RepID=A0A517QKW2_9PLAN|nr:DUF6702 family protein [Thalassoglobus polymorphus]QDT32268.1 hypothetical protein Mal48_15110 [Thalassoglobus polymorphus]